MIQLNKIGLGSVQFGLPYGISNIDGQTSDNEVSIILKQALHYGISVIDTASAYGNAETILGKNDLSKFKIISKFITDNYQTSIESELNQSLMNLKLNSIYGYLSHRPMLLLDNPKKWDELQLLKDEKKVQKIGFSLNCPKELDLLLQKQFIPDLIQVPYNYFDNRFKNNLIALKSNGCEIHTRSTFLQGLFFTNVEELPSFFDEVKEQIKDIQIDYGNNLSRSLLKYVLSLDFIDVVIMGINDSNQLENNLKDIDSVKDLPSINFTFTDSILMPSNWPQR